MNPAGDREHEIAKAEHGAPGVAGEEGEYRWLSSVDHNISDLLRLCPEIVVDRRIAVTAIDGGVLQLTDAEKEAGWWSADNRKIFRVLPDGSREEEDRRIAYSPLLQSAHGLPNETHDECCQGFDEWYVFDRDFPTCDIEVFVNWMGFRLYDDRWNWAIERFWKQLRALDVESYIAEGTVLTFATRNAGLFDAVIAAAGGA